MTVFNEELLNAVYRASSIDTIITAFEYHLIGYRPAASNPAYSSQKEILMVYLLFRLFNINDNI